MTDDLIQRLRDHASDCGEASCTTVLLKDAAVEIERLQRVAKAAEQGRQIAVKGINVLEEARARTAAERDRLFIGGRDWATRCGEQEARAERAEAERDALRRKVIAADTDSLAVIRNSKEWQAYAEKIERDTDAAMAEEVQRLRREKPRIERERDALRARIEAAPVLALDATSLVEALLPADPIAQTQDAYETAKVSAFDVQNMLLKAGLPAQAKRMRLVVEDEGKQ